MILNSNNDKLVKCIEMLGSESSCILQNESEVQINRIFAAGRVSNSNISGGLTLS